MLGAASAVSSSVGKKRIAWQEGMLARDRANSGTFHAFPLHEEVPTTGERHNHLSLHAGWVLPAVLEDAPEKIRPVGESDERWTVLVRVGVFLLRAISSKAQHTFGQGCIYQPSSS
jgi:hypothetical protein